MNFKPTQNPHLEILEGDYAREIIQAIANNAVERGLKRIRILDIGGGKGWGATLYNQDWIDYYALDINSDEDREESITYVKGDINDPGTIPNKLGIAMRNVADSSLRSSWEGLVDKPNAANRESFISNLKNLKDE